MQRVTTTSTTSSPPGASTTFFTVQALRAFAALLVVLFHALEMWGERIDPNALGADWGNGAAGVDIFFVISGFVMIVSSQRLVGQAGAATNFLRNRVVRIVPLYWLLTTVKVAAVVLLPAFAVRTSLDPSFVLGSYLFLPVIDHAAHFRPVIPVGWTLTYEFIFYALFALALAVRVDVLRVIVPGLGAVAALALLRQETWPVWTILFNTLVLEFIFGVVLAKWTLAGHRLPTSTAAVLLIGGLCAILTLPAESANARVLIWGLPAFAIVAGAVSLEPVIGKLLPRWMLSLGDASYSIYLGHGFVLPALVLIVAKTLPHNLVAELLAITLCFFASMAIGWLLYAGIEQPMLRALRSRTSPGALATQPAR